MTMHVDPVATEDDEESADALLKFGDELREPFTRGMQHAGCPRMVTACQPELHVRRFVGLTAGWPI
jgi:hypothetical protein